MIRDLTIEPMGGLHLLGQAWDVHRLVMSEQAWVSEARPKTLDRYETVFRAARSIGRAAATPEIRNGIVRLRDIAIGLGTIVLDTELDTIRGRQIDYWTTDGIGLDVHDRIVDMLANDGDYSGTVIATMTARELERAPGIFRMMTPIGGPGVVRVIGEHQFDPGQLEQSLQIYAMAAGDATRSEA
jgi:hypothetical protein